MYPQFYQRRDTIAGCIYYLPNLLRSECLVTQSPVEPPNDPSRSEESSPQPSATGPLRPLEFDETVALFIAFLSLGGVLFWGLTRGEMGLLSGDLSTIGPVATVPRTGDTPIVGDITDPEIAPDREELDAAAAAALADNDVRPSAVDELSARAAARRERLAARRPFRENVRNGAVGAAAGVAGGAIIADGADAADAEVLEPRRAVPSQAVTDAPKEPLQFDDVADDYWAKPYIDALSSRGLITGFEDGSFRPDAEVTRAQTANIVSRTFDLTADKEILEFSDVSPDYWARESIGEVVRGGFMTGFPDDTFAPGEAVTRAQAFTTLVTGLEVETPTNVQASLDRYSDANNIPNWANEKVAAATSAGFVVNHPDISELNPTQPTTRAELSAMIYQALVREGQLEPIDSTYVVKP